MTALLLAVGVLVGILCWLVLDMRRDLNRTGDNVIALFDSHEQCVARMTRNVQGEFAAIVLRDAAAKWDSVPYRVHLDRLRDEWRPGDPPVVATWLNEQAIEWLDSQV